MTRQKLALIGALAAMGLPGIASAQNPQPAPPAQPHAQVAPPSSPSPPPEQIRPADPKDGTAGQTLSDRLSRQQGTLQPPAVDPGMRKPVPQRGEGTMPVIPPPGTPGGDQKVVPK
ncbi:MAG TPA: hypothetical protein VH855_13160 [Acetobacteraceae bacterium]